MAESGSMTSRVCVTCQMSLADDANVCPNCGHDYRPLMTGRAWELENTPLPPLGGVLMALSGVTQILNGALWLSGYSWGIELLEEDPQNLKLTIGLAVVISGIFALLVSPFAMTRRRLALSLAGGVAALGGSVLVVTNMISIAAGTMGLASLLLIALARDEFVD